MTDAAATLTDLSNKAWAHAAVVAAVECGLLDDPGTAEGPVREAIADLLAALDLAEGGDGDRRLSDDLRDALAPPIGDALRAELRSDGHQIAALIDEARTGQLRGGWHHDDPDLVDAQGETGRIFGLAAQLLLPSYGDVDERLRRPGARFLDVGAGVAVLSIELVACIPRFDAVGIEPLAIAREIGERKIDAAGLSDRIELRDQLVEDLDDSDAYDLAYVPGIFLAYVFPARSPPRSCNALRPGGTIIALSLGSTGDALVDSVRRFRVAWWGGRTLDARAVQEQLDAHGFVDLFVPRVAPRRVRALHRPCRLERC
ncbi:MAG: class I SAM-dependent methyltransferase [Acidimicrobiia bacterium]|nr:class I SAM-dependent methyltransferase [Acidimicrobiia bacterium]